MVSGTGPLLRSFNHLRIRPKAPVLDAGYASGIGRRALFILPSPLAYPADGDNVI